MSRFHVRRLRARDEVVSTVKALAGEVKNDDLATLSAAVAFKIVLALFPSLLAAIAIFGLFTEPAELNKLLESLSSVAPGGVERFLANPLERLIEQEAVAGSAAIIGVAGGIWVASGAAATLNRALSRAYDTADERNFVKARGMALLVTVALVLALALIFVVLVAGGPLEDRILASLPLTDTARGVFDFLATVGRYLVSLFALMFLFAFIYFVGPDFRERPPYPWISPGAVVGVVTWLVASGLFSAYAATFGTFDRGSVYGALGNAIVFMLWLQLTMFALLLGAEVNQVLRTRANPNAASSVPDPERAPQPQPAQAASGGAPPFGPALAQEHSTDARVPSRGALPRETMIGAAVAAVSSLIGLVGLLRTRQRD